VSIKQSAAISTEKKPGKDCERTLLKRKKERRKITQKNVLTITYLRIKQVATSKIDRLLSNSGSWLEQWSRMSEEET